MGKQRWERNPRTRQIWERIAATAVIVAVVGGITAYEVRDGSANARREAQCAEVKATETKVFEARKDAAAGKLAFAVIGDSYAQGMYLDSPLDAFPYRLQAKSGGPVLVSGSGGTGYTAGGPCGARQIVNRLGAVLERKPPVLIVEAGLNDSENTDERVAVAAILTRVANTSPETKLVVLGPFAPPSQAGPELSAVRDVIREESVKRKVTFVDPSGWDFELLPDGVHPTAKGHEQIAARLFSEVGPLIQSS